MAHCIQRWLRREVIVVTQTAPGDRAGTLALLDLIVGVAPEKDTWVNPAHVVAVMAIEPRCEHTTTSGRARRDRADWSS